MAHHKYIKKNGKVYGPYLYETKRVDGKVVTTYVGPDNSGKENSLIYWRIFSIVIAVLFVWMLIALPVFVNEEISLKEVFSATGLKNVFLAPVNLLEDLGIIESIDEDLIQFSPGDILIDSTVNNNLNLRFSSRSIVWKNQNEGYLFYLISGPSIVYKKTTDGGITWSNSVSIVSLGGIKQSAIWYDRWTPGNTGTKVHIVWIGYDVTSGKSKISYHYFDTSNDQLGTEVNLETRTESDCITFPQNCVDGVNFATGMLSIVRARGGNIYVGGWMNPNGWNGFWKSVDNGVIWTPSSGAGKLPSMADGNFVDRILFVPGNELDNNNILAVYHDTSSSELTLKKYDNVANSWSESAAFASGMQVNSEFFQLDAVPRYSDGHTLVSMWSELDSLTADLRVWDVNKFSDPVISKADVLTNVGEAGQVGLLIDQQNNALYASYLRSTTNDFNPGLLSDGNTDVKYKVSCDGGASWGAERDFSFGDGANDNRLWLTAGTSVNSDGGRFMPIWFENSNIILETNSGKGIVNPSLECVPLTVTVTDIGGDVHNCPGNCGYTTSSTAPDAIISTNRKADCRFSTTDQAYSLMPAGNSCGPTGTSHTCDLGILAVSSYNYYFACQDLSGFSNDNTNNIDITLNIVTPTTINFVSPTPSHLSSMAGPNIDIAMSTSDANPHYAFLDFDKDITSAIDRDVVLFMPFSTTNGADDLSSYNRDGTLQNEAIIVSTGKFGSAVYFNDVDLDGDKINLGANYAQVQNKNALTVSAWVKSDVATTSTSLDIAGTGNSGNLPQEIFRLRWRFDESFSFFVRNSAGATADAIANSANADTNWHHVVGVYDGANVKLYVDGVLQTSQPALTGVTNPGTNVLYIGGAVQTSASYKGTIDDVIIFKRALKQAEINTLFNAAANSYSNTFSGLADGVYTFKGYSVNALGNIYSTPETPGRQVTLAPDTTSPVIGITSIGGDSVSPYSTNDNTPTALITTNENADCRASLLDEDYDNMANDVDCTGDGTTSHTCNFLAVIADSSSQGMHFACRDTAGNKNAVANNADTTVEIDTQVPSLSNILPTPGSTITTTSPIVTFNTNEIGDCKWSLNDLSYSGIVGNSCGAVGTSHSCAVTGLVDQTTNFVYISCRDNTDSVPNEDSAITNEDIRYEVSTDTTLPTLAFILPTLADNARTSNNFYEYKVDITEANLDSASVDWGVSPTVSSYNIYDNSLVFMMNFDNVAALGESLTVVKDLSGNGNDGTAGGSTLPLFVAAPGGKYEGAFQYTYNTPGTDDAARDSHFAIPDSNQLSLGVSATMSAWVLLNSPIYDDHRIMSHGGVSGTYYTFGVDDGNTVPADIGRLSFVIGSNKVLSDPTLPLNSWHHVTVVRNSNLISFYLDGVPVNCKGGAATCDVGSTVLINPTHDFWIGEEGGTGGDQEGWNGKIDEFRYWNRALTANEIKQVYSSNLRKYSANQWELYVKENSLAENSYLYGATANDIASNGPVSVSRTINVDISAPIIIFNNLEGDFVSPYQTAITAPNAVINTNENANCKAHADSDPGTFAGMQYTCSGGGTQIHSCGFTTPLSAGAHTLYFRCQDLALPTANEGIFNQPIEIVQVLPIVVDTLSGGAEDIALTALDDDTFAVAWVKDLPANSIRFKVYDTVGASGTLVTGETDVYDMNAVAEDRNRVSLAALDVTSPGSGTTNNFAVSFMDGGSGASPFDPAWRLRYYDKNGNLLGNRNFFTTIRTGTDVSVIDMTDRTHNCYVDDGVRRIRSFENKDYGIDGNLDLLGTGVTGQGSIGTTLNLHNYLECAAINNVGSGRFVSVFFDDSTATNNVKYSILDKERVVQSVPAAIVLESVGSASDSEIAVTALNKDRFAAAWYNSNVDIVKMKIINLDGTSTGLINVDTAAGTSSRIAMATVGDAGGDRFVIAWKKGGDIVAKAYDMTGTLLSGASPITLVSDASTSNLLFDIYGGDSLSGIGLCDGKFILGYTNTNNDVLVKRFKIENGNILSWNGNCPVAINNPPIVDFLDANDVLPPGPGLTPLDNAHITNNFAEIEVDISENDLDRVELKWDDTTNGGIITDYSFYDDSLVFMMNFDNVGVLGENSVIVKDFSGYGNSGTTVNGAAWTASGKFGGAYSFDGSNDYIFVPDSASLYTNNVFTISAWFKYDTLKNTINIDNTDIVANGEYYLQINDDNKVLKGFNYGSGAAGELLGVTVLSPNIWYHGVFTNDGTNRKLYLNGVLESFDLNPATIPPSALNLFIGNNPSASNRFFDGTIDEVRIWNRALSANEIKEQYNSNLKKYDVDKWKLYVKQSALVSGGIYRYKATAWDSALNTGMTEIRTLYVESLRIVDIENIGNQFPNVCLAKNVPFYVDVFSSGGQTEIGTVSANFTFDPDGAGPLMPTIRKDIDNCVYSGSSPATNVFRYNCGINIQYYDLPVQWEIFAGVIGVGAQAGRSHHYGGNFETPSEVFNIMSTASAVSHTGSLQWGSFLPGATNQEVAMALTNCGNDPYAIGDVKLQAHNLLQQLSGTGVIPAANFRVDKVQPSCSGLLLDNTLPEEVIPGFSLPIKNDAGEGGIRTLYFCLNNVPTGLPAATYKATGSNTWELFFV